MNANKYSSHVFRSGRGFSVNGFVNMGKGDAKNGLDEVSCRDGGGDDGAGVRTFRWTWVHGGRWNAATWS